MASYRPLLLLPLALAVCGAGPAPPDKKRGAGRDDTRPEVKEVRRALIDPPHRFGVDARSSGQGCR